MTTLLLRTATLFLLSLASFYTGLATLPSYDRGRSRIISLKQTSQITSAPVLALAMCGRVSTNKYSLPPIEFPLPSGL